MSRHPEAAFWLCVGDIATGDGRYESLDAPIYWIHGNNDNFDAIAAADLPRDLHHIRNGTAVDIAARPGRRAPSGPFAEPSATAEGKRSGVLRVAGLGGTFAPTWYESRATDLPHPKKGSAKATELADKRRHFVREEAEAAAALRGVDVFMTHEAAQPFRPFPGGRGPDAGKAQINEILAAMRPRLHLFGHHHRLTDEEREGVRSIGLDLVTRSYLLVEAESVAVQVIKSEDR